MDGLLAAASSTAAGKALAKGIKDANKRFEDVKRMLT
jgi:hypothetical protein